MDVVEGGDGALCVERMSDEPEELGDKFVIVVEVFGVE